MAIIIIWSARIDGDGRRTDRTDAVATTWRRKEECLGSQTTVIMCVASVWAEDEDPQDKKVLSMQERERERKNVRERERAYGEMDSDNGDKQPLRPKTDRVKHLVDFHVPSSSVQ